MTTHITIAQHRFLLMCSGLLALLLITTAFSPPAEPVTQVCPAVPIQLRGMDFQPGGIILTTFDKSGLWVYNINTNARYPLPETRPCNQQCRLSPDARWITYIDPASAAIQKMRLDGTERTLLSTYAADIEWWPDNYLLIWTPAHQAYWRQEGTYDMNYMDVSGIVSVQPGGRWGLQMRQEGDGFTRALINLEMRELQGIAGGQIDLGEDRIYFNAAAWSDDGQQLVYTSPVSNGDDEQPTGSELFIVRPDSDTTPVQLTDFSTAYGAVRINGGLRGDISWSPDNVHLAFWVIELIGPDHQTDTGSASIHVLNTLTGETRSYCGFTTTEHTPEPPRLQWSPDGTHITFAGNIPGDDKGYLLLALDTYTGIFTELSEGVYPALGIADVVAWGLGPNQ